MSNYSAMLRDPRWQKKRLEIMERDKFACVVCFAKDKTLNVHHGEYIKDCKPWEYSSDTLHTLCEHCHAEVEYCLKLVRGCIARMEPRAFVCLYEKNAGLLFTRHLVDSFSELNWEHIEIEASSKFVDKATE